MPSAHDVIEQQQKMMNAMQQRYASEERLREAQFEHMKVCEKAYLKRIAEGIDVSKPIQH